MSAMVIKKAACLFCVYLSIMYFLGIDITGYFFTQKSILCLWKKNTVKTDFILFFLQIKLTG